jgi:Flp pilus assembly protein TadD
MESLRSRAKLACLLTCVALPACATHSEQHQVNLDSHASARVAEAAEQSGDDALATQMYGAASSATPGDASVQLRYADLLLRHGKTAEAQDLLVRRLGAAKDSQQAQQLRIGLADLYVLEGQPTQAIATFDEALASDPHNLHAVVNKGVALDLLGKHAEAQTLYRQALAQSPGDADVVNDLALSMLLAGNAEGAAKVAALLAQQSDASPRIRDSFGVVLAASGDLAAAREAAGDTARAQQFEELAKAAALAAHH